MKKLFIDLGHSKKYPGAASSVLKTSEIAFNRAVWIELKKLLDPKKWQVIEVPTDYGKLDTSANRQLVNRINFINRNSTAEDFLLSIHANAASNPNVRGVTTCYMGGSESARREAAKLSKTYAQITGVPVWNGGAFDDRNARFGRIGIVRDTDPFALLIEAGFVTNAKDMAVTPKKSAEAIAKYYNTFPL